MIGYEGLKCFLICIYQRKVDRDFFIYVVDLCVGQRGTKEYIVFLGDYIILNSFNKGQCQLFDFLMMNNLYILKRFL